MPTESSRPTSPRPKARTRVKLLAALLSLTLTLALGELVARAMTCTTPLGTMCIGGFAGVPRMELLPHRPSREQVAAAWDHFSKAPFLARDTDLGWIPIAANPDTHVSPQSLHAQRDRVFDEAVPAGKKRIVAMGDSVVFATNVEFEETWSYLTEERRPDFEVMNFGVPGYGPTQAFLRWRRDARKFDADLTIFGIWPDNLFRALSINRYYLTFGELPRDKPRFLLEDGALRLVNSPIRGRDQMVEELSSETLPVPNHDWWIRPHHLESKWWYHVRALRVVASVLDRWERRNIYRDLYSGRTNIANEVTVAISKAFAEEAAAAGSIPVIVLFPAPDLIFDWREENSMPLVRQLRAAGLRVLDLQPVYALEADRLGDQEPLFRRAHLSPLGNEIFVRELTNLADELLGSPKAPNQGARR